MSSIAIEPFKIPFKSFYLAGNRWSTDGQLGELLLLHGAGKVQCSGFLKLRKTLVANGIGSVAFDFVGHGETGGELHGSSLCDRTNQALTIIDSLGMDSGNLSVLGFSMGAYIAMQISAQRHVLKLGLAIPAVYSRMAYRIPFGPKFTQCIRKPNNWCMSDGFEILRKFTGHLLVISAEKDQVIPSIIPNKLYANAQLSSYRVHHKIASSGHDLAAHYKYYPMSRYLTLREIITWYFEDIAPVNEQTSLRDSIKTSSNYIHVFNEE